MRQLFRALQGWWRGLWSSGEADLLADLPDVFVCRDGSREEDPITVTGWELSDYNGAPMFQLEPGEPLARVRREDA